MKKMLLIGIITLLGVGLLGYPFIAEYFSKKNSSFATDTYAEKVAGLTDEDIQKAWDEAVMYNENLSGNPVHDPFVAGSGMVMPDNYYTVLSIEETMGYITIPKIDVRLPLYHGTAESTLQNGVGHLEGSSMPVGGVGTHSVLTGHTGLTNAKMFTDLTALVKGDTFFLHVLNQTLAYQVDQILITEPENTGDLRRVNDQDYCTLVTCTPYGVNSHRLLVRGVRINYVEELEAEAAAAAKGLTEEQKLMVKAIAISSAVMIVIITIIITLSRSARKRRQGLDGLTKEIDKGETKKN